jgi:hypothetical protein
MKVIEAARIVIAKDHLPCTLFAVVGDFSHVDKILRPICDQAYQTFGLRESLSFNDAGQWLGWR